MKIFLPTITLATTILFGCDSTPEAAQDEAELSINMQIEQNAQSGSINASQDDELILEGSNGTLTITEIGLVVAEFELEFEEDTCDEVRDGSESNDQDDDACERFEFPPSFVDLPLPSGAVVIGTDLVPAGQYKELEFEVEDLEDDEDNSEEIIPLFNSIRETYPDWPHEASMVVIGEFAHVDGSPVRPFTIYVEAEIEVEMEFDPPLTIEAGDQNRSLTIEINPENWFKRAGGTVWDLSQIDFNRTSEVLQFEVEMKEGFSSIKFDN